MQSSNGVSLSGFDITISEKDENNWVARASLNDQVASGYYALVFTVHDGNSSGEKVHLAAGFAETVRVIKGNQTSVSQALKGVKGIGSIDLGIELDINDNLPLAILDSETYPQHFAFDSITEFTVSADVSEDDADFGNIIKTWYLNGQMVEVGPTFTINAATSPLSTTYNGRYISGHYRLDVAGVTPTGERSGSASYEFLVTGDQVAAVQQGSINGQVFLNFATTKPSSYQLSALEVKLKNVDGTEVQGAVLLQNDTGLFGGENIAIGDYVLEISLGNGYLPYSTPIKIEAGQLNDLGIVQLMNGTQTNISSTQASTVTLDEKASIKFPINAFKKADGSVYTGNVNVSHRAMNPSDAAFVEAFPGGFTGISTDADGQPLEVDIISFGVIGAKLTDDNGNPLNIADGKTATISIDVANPETAPLTMPLWHLDPVTGKWVEEGEATLQGDKYVGEVSHFSWWNFDYSCGVTDSGRLSLDSSSIRSHRFARKWSTLCQDKT